MMYRDYIPPELQRTEEKQGFRDLRRLKRVKVGKLEATRSAILMRDLPTSSTGLPTGSVWNNGGTLQIVT